VPPSDNPGNFVGRGVPDVAGDADPNTGYNVQVDGSSFAVGGTSAVAPLWAGLIALFNQSLGKSVGYLNPTLYQNVGENGSFHDITSGNNGDYSAGPGWDPCSASDSLSKVKPKIKVKNKSAGEWGMKPIPQRSYAAAPAAAAVAGKARLASNRAPCLNMPNVACSNLRMTATRATILHFPRSCSRR
jgi:hypothetical protein